MAIEITGLTNSVAQNLETTPQAPQIRNEANNVTPHTKPPATPTTGDTAEFTDTAQQLLALANAVKAAPVVDLHRIDEIKTALTNGSYDFNSSRTAEKFMQLESMLSMRGAQTR